MDNLVLTVEECAQELKVSPKDVMILINNKELSAKKIGTEYRITLSHFYQYLDITMPKFLINNSNAKFDYWAQKWLEIYKKPNVTENTYIGTYLLYVNNHLIPYFGNKCLNQIKPIDVQEFLSKKKHLSQSSLNKIMICLNGIFKTAIDNDLCDKNPTIFVSAKSDKTKCSKRVYTDEQEQIIRQIAMKEMPGIILSLETGVRPGEFTGIKWSDIENNVLNVSRSIAFSKKKRFIIRPPKWNSYRSIPLSSIALEALNNMRNNDIYIFPYHQNEPYTPRTWDKIVKRFFDRVLINYPDMPILAPHEFRHTFGTKLRRKGIDIYTIQKLMGHKSIKVTTETYVHNEIDVLKQAMGL